MLLPYLTTTEILLKQFWENIVSANFIYVVKNILTKCFISALMEKMWNWDQ